MATSADRTYEEQNDNSLNKLYDKVKALVSVGGRTSKAKEAARVSEKRKSS